MGFGEHRPFGCVRWRHARLQTTEQTAGPGRWKIPPGVQPRCSACWVDRSQVRGTGRQPGSRRELAGASQLSCPHSDSRILSAQASRQDKDLREACGGLLGPWSFSEVAALGGGLLPVPQPSEWSQDHCLHGQAGRALAGVVGRTSLCLLLLAASFHLVTLGGHALAQASLCSSRTVGLASWKGTKPAQQTWEVQTAGLQDLGWALDTSRGPCAGSQHGGLCPCLLLAAESPRPFPAHFRGGPSQSLELLSGMFTHKHFNIAGRSRWGFWNRGNPFVALPGFM